MSERDGADTRSVPSVALQWEQTHGQLGDGACSVVYDAAVRAGPRCNPQRVALKVLRKAEIERLHKASAVANERNVCERICAELPRSPTLCKLLFTSKDSNRLFMAFELCELGDLLQLATSRCGLPPADVLFYTRQLSDALRCLHSITIIHGDVKPENCVLSSSDSSLKLTDFDSAADVSDEVSKGEEGRKEHRHIAFSGSFEYAPPEVLLGGKGVSFTADVYGIGLVVCAAIEGERPDRTCLLSEGESTSYGVEMPKVLMEAREVKELVQEVCKPIEKGRPATAHGVADRWGQDD